MIFLHAYTHGGTSVYSLMDATVSRAGQTQFGVVHKNPVLHGMPEFESGLIFVNQRCKIHLGTALCTQNLE